MRSRRQLLFADQLLDESLQQDSQFAPHWELRAGLQPLLGEYTDTPLSVDELERRGYQYADRALSLAPDSALALAVKAQANPDLAEPGAIVADLRRNLLPGLLAENPGVRERLGGASLEQRRGQTQLVAALVSSLFLIYALLAIPLKSYLQPLLIMAVIPFGALGALFGHLLMGLSFSFLSMVGLIALSGVVVNDSLILVHRVNALRAAGIDLYEAVVEAATSRFRPILLTSLTTFFGLAPMLLERSLQAQFIIPMATSLAFGILFATVITLFLIPALYVLRPGNRAVTQQPEMSDAATARA